jgi:hypothetical protein
MTMKETAQRDSSRVRPTPLHDWNPLPVSARKISKSQGTSAGGSFWAAEFVIDNRPKVRRRVGRQLTAEIVA